MVPLETGPDCADHGAPSAAADRWVASAAALLAFGVALWAHHGALTNYYEVDEDVLHHVYWVEQFVDPDLFPNDLLVDYSRSIQPWGFVLLYRILCPLIEPLWISKLLPLALFPLTALLLFGLVKSLHTRLSAALAVLVFVSTPLYLGRMAGGLPRAFSIPLLLALLCLLRRRAWIAAAAVVVLQSLLYPVTYLVGVGTYGLSFLRIQRRGIRIEIPRRKLLALAAAIALSGLVIFSKYVWLVSPEIGTTVTRAEMLGKPEFYAQGWRKILPLPSFERVVSRTLKKSNWVLAWARDELVRGAGQDTLRRLLAFLALLVPAFLILEIWRRRVRLPEELVHLLLSSTVLFFLAELLLFKLYIPERYLRDSVAIVSLVLLAMAAGQLIAKLPGSWARGAATGTLGALILTGLPGMKNVHIVDYSPRRSFFERVSLLPKDVMIAAHPRTADGIPTFARRSVFVKYELSHPWVDKYWEEIRRRTYELFDAYYSEDLSQVANFCRRNGIDVLIVDRRHFASVYLAEGRFYFEPFNEYARRLVAGRTRFALASPPPEAVLFSVGSLSAIDPKRLVPLTAPAAPGN